MTNEEFQRLILEKLNSLDGRLENVEKGLRELNKMVDPIHEQTAELTEFKSEISYKLDEIMENDKSFNEIIEEHEIAIRSLRRMSI
ncbi:hypothetical protein [Tepidimicrobium xylanilyticum]|uniref:Uncharacterized protein n=1 Tax=Tepidimicrobium xylanilyticum TaxID=1123352 RepID=A0A1H2T760_9FIRM|nr:hypothetical protein [Tepidimicrobium xylanilyticum]GMG96011.1 hypothetical protein EN5CB1_08370 [Tepidimicrobium xylanilyticum]SDW39721.1 hypothetical protein SAMN05660923_00645 [Tepidimicrobium xylanilyticum]